MINIHAGFAAACFALLPGLADAQPFRHPGVVVDKSQLDFVKAKIQAGEQPWKNAFDKMKASSYASPSYAPKPRADVECGSYSSPNNGCSEERGDAAAAYAHALLWAYTGNKADADKAIQILNAWSAVLKTHSNSNAPLQAGWASSLSVRAAEIIRHTNAGWAQADVDRFSAMLRNAYLPYFTKIGVGTNGNWHLITIDAALGIAVFLDDHELFNSYLAKWRERTRAYLYVSDDGPAPVLPEGLTKTASTYWYGMNTYMDGLAQETCRDFGHTGYGLASINTAAETALLQGVNLYGEEAKRIVAGMEFHAAYILGKAVPKELCGGNLNLSTSPTWEVSYNHFANRLGMAMPFTKKLIETKARPTGVDHHMAWETLTHAETGKAALAGMPDGGSISVLEGARPERSAPKEARLVVGEDWKLRVLRPGAGGRLIRYGLNGTLQR
jgi:hypothetical protein